MSQKKLILAMEVEGWDFISIFGNTDKRKSITLRLAEIVQHFDVTEENAVADWLTSIPKDATFIIDTTFDNPFYKGRFFTAWSVKENSISNKALVKSGDFQYDTFIGLGKKKNMITQKVEWLILQRVDLLYCSQCIRLCGIRQPKKLSGGIKISNDQTTTLHKHLEAHKKSGSQSITLSQTQYEQKVCFALASCNLPFLLVDQKPFRQLLPFEICHRTKFSDSVYPLLPIVSALH